MYASDRPVDYLIIGHVSKDLTPDGPALGGTAAYSSLTAQAIGKRAAIITSASHDLDLHPLSEVSIHRVPSQDSTIFSNKYLPEGRIQSISATAAALTSTDIPDDWRDAPIVHIAPIANEVDSSILDIFPHAFICLTPQGWLRRWGPSGEVWLENWEIIQDQISRAGAVVFSIEDLEGNEETMDQISRYCEILAITEGDRGARVFWANEWRQIPAPVVEEIDPTGAGDIFAAAFFIFLNDGHSPWIAARFANHLAAFSVTRSGIASVPRSTEVKFSERTVIE
ncbi:MAG: PfkB family carbohydrate kinase [Anaerolineales bacterium]|jgi:sugar/nucleoside kinase (ribokinase family)|nr:PfkB family carbohydrate kinase [Anaerolineales bacterium]